MSILLTSIIGLPFAGALAVAVIPRSYRFVIRSVALLATLVSMLLAIYLFTQFQTGLPGYQFVHELAWIPSLGINYHVGVDGLNVGMILMGAIVAFAATCLSREIKEREKEFYFLLLIMIGGILGAFASLDLFFFFAFHEFALIPTFIMIGVWGRGENRNYATFNITIYLTIGALLALIGLIALSVQAGANSFDIRDITAAIKAKPLTQAVQAWIFPLLLFGFGILVSLWPFHTWAPLGYAAAPTATAMLHAGVLKKFGLYGLIRIAIPLMPSAAQSWMQILAVLCLGNILFCGFVAMRQRDLNRLIGNSSVAHMGFVFLGIASLTTLGVTGAVVIMIAHGLLAALSFGISGHIYNQTKSLDMDQMGGFLKPMPFVGSAMVMAMMAGCGLPGFANFVGESMTLFAAWKVFPVVTSLAIWGGLVIGAVYMLRAIRSVLHGPVSQMGEKMVDAVSFWRKLPFALLLVGLLIFGVWPRLLTDKVKPCAEEIVAMATFGQPTAKVEPPPVKGKQLPARKRPPVRP